MTRMAHNFNIYHGGRQISLRKKRKGRERKGIVVGIGPCIPRRLEVVVSSGKCLYREKICFQGQSPLSLGQCLHVWVSVQDGMFVTPLSCCCDLASSWFSSLRISLRSGTSFNYSPSFHHCCRFISVFA